MNLTQLTSTQFKQIVSFLEKKEALQARVNEIDQELSAFDGGEAKPAPVPAPAAAAGRGKYKRSPAARARMAAGQKARWARKNGGVSAGPVNEPSLAPYSTVTAKPGRKARVKVAKAGEASRSKRGAVKEAIIAVVQAAGKAGISVKDVATRLGVKYGNVSVWFGSTGKKVKEIKRVGRGTYAWVK